MENIKTVFWNNVTSKVKRENDNFSEKLVDKMKILYSREGINGVKELFDELDRSVDIGRIINED